MMHDSRGSSHSVAFAPLYGRGRAACDRTDRLGSSASPPFNKGVRTPCPYPKGRVGMRAEGKTLIPDV